MYISETRYTYVHRNNHFKSCTSIFFIHFFVGIILCRVQHTQLNFLFQRVTSLSSRFLFTARPFLDLVPAAIGSYVTKLLVF